MNIGTEFSDIKDWVELKFDILSIEIDDKIKELEEWTSIAIELNRLYAKRTPYEYTVSLIMYSGISKNAKAKAFKWTDKLYGQTTNYKLILGVDE